MKSSSLNVLHVITYYDNQYWFIKIKLLHVLVRLIILFSEWIVALTIFSDEGLAMWPYVLVLLSFFRMNCSSNHYFLRRTCHVTIHTCMSYVFSEWIVALTIIYYDGFLMWPYVLVRLSFFRMNCNYNHGTSFVIIFFRFPWVRFAYKIDDLIESSSKLMTILTPTTTLLLYKHLYRLISICKAVILNSSSKDAIRYILLPRECLAI